MPTFQFDGKTYEVLDAVYNDTALNERGVEVPLARDFIYRHGLDLEVGNVLRHYGHTRHKVIDRYELDPHVENLDVFDIAGEFGSVVAISTLEHVRWDEPERDCDAAVRALEHLRCISQSLFVTVPMGFHPALDTHLLYGPHKATRASTLVRRGDSWFQSPTPVWKRYGPWANSVWVGEWTAT